MADGLNLLDEKMSTSQEWLDHLSWNLVRWGIFAFSTLPAVKKLEFLKTKMADVRHFENRKSPCFGNDFTDCNQIWHDDVYSPSQPCQPLKCRNFTNPRWRMTAMLKIRKLPYLSNSSTDCRHGDLNWTSSPCCPLKFVFLKIQGGRRPLF